jgi:hypothetical protein
VCSKESIAIRSNLTIPGPSPKKKKLKSIAKPSG